MVPEIRLRTHRTIKQHENKRIAELAGGARAKVDVGLKRALGVVSALLEDEVFARFKLLHDLVCYEPSG